MKQIDCKADYVVVRDLLIGGIRLERGDRLPKDSPMRQLPQRLELLCKRGHLIVCGPEESAQEAIPTAVYNSVSVVTMSYYSDIFERLRQSLDVHEPDARKIVVTSGELNGAELDGWTVVEGVAPFQFSKAANIGIAAAGTDDVLLVNDDCELTTPVVTTLQKICVRRPEIGILSPQIIGQVGNSLQGSGIPLGANLSYSARHLCFVCVYIPRKTIDLVGLLDERFTGYGKDDADYCIRVQNAGLKLAVTPMVRVVHGGFGKLACSSSYLRQMTFDEYRSSNREMRKLLTEKWGRR